MVLLYNKHKGYKVKILTLVGILILGMSSLLVGEKEITMDNSDDRYINLCAIKKTVVIPSIIGLKITNSNDGNDSNDSNDSNK